MSRTRPQVFRGGARRGRGSGSGAAVLRTLILQTHNAAISDQSHVPHGGDGDSRRHLRAQLLLERGREHPGPGPGAIMGHPGPGVRGPSPLVPRPSDVQKGPKLSKFKIQNSKNNAKMGLGKKSNQQYGKAIQYCRAREPAWGGRRSTQTQPKSKIYVGSVCSRTRVTEPGVRCLRVRSGNWKCDADMAFVRALHCELVMPRMRMLRFPFNQMPHDHVGALWHWRCLPPLTLVLLCIFLNLVRSGWSPMFLNH